MKHLLSPRNKVLRSLVLIPALLLFFFLPPLQAQEVVTDTTGAITITPEKEWDLFGREHLLRLTLIYDGKLYRKNLHAPEYQKALLRIQLEDGSWIEKPVKIKARGNFRRNYCSFPPFKLNIKKADFDNDYLDKTGAMKFVTQCKHSREFETYLLKEYLIYKMYNVLTDYSFRARLVEMTYVDSSRKKHNTFTKYGFLIEPLKNLTKRLNAVYIKSGGVKQLDMIPEDMARVALFEYMIGNTDWSLPGQHNVKVIKLLNNRHPGAIPVPYDFDFTGLINTTYALPAENSGLTSVRQRLYRGICLPDSVTDKTANLFLDKKEAIENVIRDFRYLDEKHKKNMLYYLEKFFNTLEDKKVRQNLIFRDCLPDA
jgi:hypothetical protein